MIKLKIKGIIGIIIIFRIAFLVISFYHCQDEIEERLKDYEKAVYLVKVISTNDSQFNSKYVQFKIIEVNNRINTTYTGLKGFAYINNERYYQLLEKLSLNRLEGVKLIVKGNFSAIKRVSNPGDKSRWSIYLSQKSLGKLDTDDIEAVGLNRKSYISIYLKVKHHYIDLKELIQEQLKSRISELYLGDTNNLLVAMLLGDKQNMDASVEGEFQKTGISHIIAISGLHIGMLYLLISTAISLFTKNRKIKFIWVLSILCFYNLIIGYNVSAIRATTMILVYVYAMTFYKCYNKERSFYMCVTIYLLIYPESIFSGGFVLSYGAVLGLFYLYPFLKYLVSYQSKEVYKLSAVGVILDLALISISVNLMTLPVLIYLFNGISLVSVITNVLIVPVVMSFYTLGIVTLVISLAHHGLALFLAGTVEIISSYIISLTRIISRLSFSFYYIKTPSLFLIIIYYLLMYVVIKLYLGSESEFEKTI